MSNNFDILEALWLRKEKKRRAQKIIEGALPLTYTAKNAGTLKNYRIYGNTVSSESVGDKTSNLFDEAAAQNVTESVSVNKWVHIQVGEGAFTLSTNMPNIGTSEFAANIFFLAGNVSTGANSATNGVADNIPITVSSSDGYVTVGLRNANSYNPKDYNIMLNTGSTPLPYEPYGYRVPVTVSNGTDTLTTPIYLPEQIKKVGDEAEYIDYAEQKQHRVRKNLLQNTTTSQTINGVTFTVNTDGSVTCNNTATANSIFRIGIYLDAGVDYILSGCLIATNGGRIDLRKSNAVVVDKDGQYVVNSVFPYTFQLTKSGYYDVCIRIVSGYTCDNLTFYPMIRKAGTVDDTYEPYIENTELDVTLPALPTIAGTNTLSVGTEVQPSKVMVRGKLKE